MGIQLEVGKKYVDRKGRVYGPMVKATSVHFGEETVFAGWYANGMALSGTETSLDLVAEYVEPPTPEPVDGIQTEPSSEAPLKPSTAGDTSAFHIANLQDRIGKMEKFVGDRFNEDSKFIAALRDDTDRQVVALEAKIANLLSRVEKLESPSQWTFKITPGT